MLVYNFFFLYIFHLYSANVDKYHVIDDHEFVYLNIIKLSYMHIYISYYYEMKRNRKEGLRGFDAWAA